MQNPSRWFETDAVSLRFNPIGPGIIVTKIFSLCIVFTTATKGWYNGDRCQLFTDSQNQSKAMSPGAMGIDARSGNRGRNHSLPLSERSSSRIFARFPDCSSCRAQTAFRKATACSRRFSFLFPSKSNDRYKAF